VDKKFQVNLLPQAEEDFQEIIDFIAEERPSVTDKMLDKFLHSFSQLAITRKQEERPEISDYTY
jgi:plasmid stabilization system protein ParE